MCDYCGCPGIEPFRTLTVEHEVLHDLALAAGSGDALARSDLVELWGEHVERERAALGPLAERLGLADVVTSHVASDGPTQGLIVGNPPPDRLMGAVRDHADAWEFEVFPHLVMAAEDDELVAAAGRAGLWATIRS